MPDTPRPRSAPSLVGGALLGAAVGVLGTATHLNVAPLAAGWTLPWGAVLALLLAGSAQWWWMGRTARRGGRPVPAGAAVGLAAFTAATALCRMPGPDRLGLPWSVDVLQAMPGAALASLAWVLGLPVLTVALLAAAARRPGRRREYPGRKPRNPQNSREADGRP